MLLGKLRDVELGIRGLLRGFGLKVGRISKGRYEARIERIERVIDAGDLSAQPADAIERNQVGEVVIHTRSTVPLDAYETNSKTGRFVLVAGSQIAGGGMKMGMEHIFTGIDHMSFMLGLVLISRRIRDLLFVVTGFTIGHSLTLALAVTGILRPHAEFIDALVAFTIAMRSSRSTLALPARPRPAAP